LPSGTGAEVPLGKRDLPSRRLTDLDLRNPSGSPKAEPPCATQSPLPDITGPALGQLGRVAAILSGDTWRWSAKAANRGPAARQGEPGEPAGETFHFIAEPHRLLQRNTIGATKRLFRPNPLPPLHKCVATAEHASETVVRADRARKRPPRSARHPWTGPLRRASSKWAQPSPTPCPDGPRSPKHAKGVLRLTTP
jgi:hypothetical protein